VVERCGRALSFLEEVLEDAFEFGHGEVRPNLVSRTRFTTTKPYTLVYTIRPEARWSDGTPAVLREVASVGSSASGAG